VAWADGSIAPVASPEASARAITRPRRSMSAETPPLAARAIGRPVSIARSTAA
jgi:hypothetical protein